MVLFHKVQVDLLSFDESQFGIFNEAESALLLKMFVEECDRSAPKFYSMLSPEQKNRVALWACQRSSFSVEDLICAISKFLKYLKNVKFQTWPQSKATGTKKKEKNLSVAFK